MNKLLQKIATEKLNGEIIEAKELTDGYSGYVLAVNNTLCILD